MDSNFQHNSAMTSKKRVVVVGAGNVGLGAIEAALRAPDLELVGVVRREARPVPGHPEIPVGVSVDEFGFVDGALLCGPTRSVGAQAVPLLERGICTADSFDIHGDPLVEHRAALDRAARAGKAVAVLAAGWDPGLDSVIRILMEAGAPEGTSHTTFGPGMSMGHTVAARAIPGVRDAVSMTLPAGPGVHRREVFVELEPGADAEEVKRALRADPYFAKDETEVVIVERAADHVNTSHGVQLERVGRSGAAEGQRFGFTMRIDNPALTGQILVAALRAAFRQPPGAYTMIELPPVDLLPGKRTEWVRTRV